MSFVFTLNIKSCRRHIFYLILSTNPVVPEVSHSFVHVTFTTLIVSEIDSRNLFKVVYK